jgi:hypothetical protein
MLKLIENLPDDVVGVTAVGEVTGSDYTSVLVAEIESRLKRHETIRFLYVLGDAFSSFSADAAWQDTKIGMRHLTRFERVAIVTDTDWLRRTITAFSIVMPGQVRVFPTAEIEVATAWVSAPRDPGKLVFELDREHGVLVVEPREGLVAEDFERVAEVVDPYIESSGKLRGVVIVAEAFPGWKNLAAMSSHFRFVREHHRKIRRVAVVSDSHLLSAVPGLATAFVNAEVRGFPAAERAEALQWASERA